MSTVVNPPDEATKSPTRANFIQDFAYTGPDTLAGQYMRRFWQPVHLSRDLPAGRALPIRIMNEDFTLYRGTTGTAHIVDFRCAHRGTQLSTGTVEDDCIRCLYHGWMYDETGQCVEQPAEDENFAAKVRIGGYPTREYLGLIWVYLGPGEAPELRRFKQLEDEGEDGIRLTVGGNPRPFNFVNDLENDPAHVPFVHGGTEFFTDVPRVRTEETEYGTCETVTTKERGDIGWVHRIFPNARCFAISLPHGIWVEFVLWLVPIDDTNHQGFACVIAHREGGRKNERFVQAMSEWEEQARGRDEVPGIVERILRGEMFMDDAPRDADMRSRRMLVQIQDATAQMGQGVVRDRINERLGRSDTGVILLRKVWDRELRALASGEPLKEWKLPDRFKLDSNYHNG
ncbi:MAG: Rieske 2Fe-2S domain-containing protein [Vulcanimicrobiaceae bacterium]|jgi:5,5'-dehydrodivanillate O-demethylase